MERLKRNDPLRLMLIPAVFVLMGASLVSAQDNATIAVAPQAALPAAVAAPKSADWRNDIGTFKIGMVRGWASDMSRPALDRVESVFTKALGVPAKVVVFERFTSLMDAQADGRVDFAAYSARAFAAVRLMCECVDAIAAPTNARGDTGQVAVFAANPAQMTSLASIGPAKIGRVSSAKIATQDMLRGTLTINGKVIRGDESFWVDFPDYASALRAYQASEIAAVVYPATATFANQSVAGIPDLPFVTESTAGTTARPATVLWRSPYWPFGPIALRRNLAAEAKDIVLRTLEQIDVAAPLSHAVLSEGLAGPFQKAETLGYGNVSSSLRLLVSQNAKWR